MYTVHQAKTNLSKLLRKAARGEEVVIWHTPPDVFEPLTKEELSEWGIK